MNDLSEAVAVSIKYQDPSDRIPSEIDLGEVQKAPPKDEAKSTPALADEGIDGLRRQLEEKRREVAETQRQRLEAERIAFERGQQLHSVTNDAQRSQHTAVVNAIASFERDAENLEARYASFMENGDFREAAKIQRQMYQIEAKLNTLHEGREQLEHRLQNPPEPPRPPIQQMPRNTIDEQIAHLSPQSQDWIRAHPDVMTDPKLNNLMTAGHYEAVANGFQIDTPEYFSHIASKVGYGDRSEPNIQRQQVVVQSPSQGRVPIASAPVTRSSPSSVRQNGNSIEVILSPAMRQMAADLDMSEEEYAQNHAYYVNRGDIQTR